MTFRVALLGATCGAVAVWTCFDVASRLARAVGATGAAASWLAAAAAVALMLSGAHLAESTRPEVYALNAALVLLALNAALRFTEEEAMVHARNGAVWLGLGLTNHHYLVVFALPAVAVAWLLVERGRRAPIGRWLGLTMLGGAALMLYAYLPIRAATEPVIDWGHPVTLSRFWDVLSAKTFQQSVSAETRGAPIGENVAVALGMWGDSLGPGVLALGLCGAVIAALHARRLALVLGVAVLGSLMTKAIMFIDPDNPDDYGYFYVGIALCAALATAPASALLRRVGPSRWAGALGATVIVAAAGAGAMDRLVHHDRASDRSAEAFGDAILSPLPTGAVALVDFYQLYFTSWYAQLVEGARPDVAVVQASFDSRRDDGEPYVAALERRHPELAGMVAAFRAERGFPTAALLTLAAQRPVFLEPTVDDRVPMAMIGREGLLRRIGPRAATGEGAAVWADLARRATVGHVGHDGRMVFDWTCFLAVTTSLRQEADIDANGVLAMWSQLGEAGPPESLKTLSFAASAARVAAERAPPPVLPFASLWRAVVADVVAEITPTRVFAR